MNNVNEIQSTHDSSAKPTSSPRSGQAAVHSKVGLFDLMSSTEPMSFEALASGFGQEAASLADTITFLKEMGMISQLVVDGKAGYQMTPQGIMVRDILSKESAG